MQADIARALVRQTKEQVELSRVQLINVRRRLTQTQRCIERARQILECDGYVLPNVNAPLVDFSEPQSSNNFSTNGHVSDFYLTEIRIADSERETAEVLYHRTFDHPRYYGISPL